MKKFLADIRPFVLWLLLMVFVIMGCSVGGLPGAVCGGWLVIALGLPVQSLTPVGIVIFVTVLLPSLTLGIYLFYLVWLVCMRPFFTGAEVASVAFYYPPTGFSWPEKWLFRQLYPEEPLDAWMP